MAERRFRAASSSSGGNSTAGTASGAAGVMDGSRAVHPALHVDLSRPRHDQSTYWGRARHFMETVNPLNILASPAKLEEAARTVHAYKRGEVGKGITESQLWKAKRLYDSAYHPDTGEKMFIVGRMSFQVYGNMTIIGLMMTFHKHPASVVFWQLANQTFNAIVNYTNRSGDQVITYRDLAVPFVAATTGATTAALVLNSFAKRMPPLVGRFVPLAAVATANTINIPLVRQRELREGITVVDGDDNQLGSSQITAQRAIGQVVFSRIVMAVPGMGMYILIIRFL
ncbi:Sideroflexin-1 [Geodia barretti]|uniref:Sideroflexin-1 n=1 Tax=Geodia barretti TaxID=519541 RepID=A0AA35XH94_GEOBA|nr:Sideroflexin-1 [Geodia barretti]